MKRQDTYLKLDKDILFLYLIENYTNVKRTQFKGSMCIPSYDCKIDIAIEDVNDLDYTIFNGYIYLTIYSPKIEEQLAIRRVYEIQSDYIYHINYSDYMVYQRETKLKQIGI